MSILNSQTIVPRELTLEEKQARMKRQALGMARTAFEGLKRIQKEGIRLGWQNPSLTPEEAAAALGTDAAKIFRFHGIITDAIVQISQLDGVEPDIELPTSEFTINEDSTLTIGPGPYVPAP